MLTRKTIPVFCALLLSVVLGAGCAAPSTEPTIDGSISNPQPLSLQGASSDEAAKRITFSGGNVIMMRQSFTGRGVELAESIGFGPTAERWLAIKRFAPSVLAEVEWRVTTEKRSGVGYVYSGTVQSGNLRDSRVLYPPAYWTEGMSDAFGTGIVWLSQEVFENLSKAGISTLRFGIEDGQMLEFANASPQLREDVRALQAEIKRVIDRTDVFLTRSTEGTRDLLVNGATSTVDVLIAKNWFGEIVVLDNPHNPLVLEMNIATPGGIDFGGLFDYHITELRELTQ